MSLFLFKCLPIKGNFFLRTSPTANAEGQQLLTNTECISKPSKREIQSNYQTINLCLSPQTIRYINLYFYFDSNRKDLIFHKETFRNS